MSLRDNAILHLEAKINVLNINLQSSSRFIDSINDRVSEDIANKVIEASHRELRLYNYLLKLVKHDI
jgi:hypothetical protein